MPQKRTGAIAIFNEYYEMKKSFLLHQIRKYIGLFKENIPCVRPAIFGSIIIATSYLILPVMANGASASITQNISPPATHQTRVALFNQAIADDLSGHNQAARKVYDDLTGSDMSAEIAVPSAINLVALGKFDAAEKAFDGLAASADARVSDYAHLWQLWLSARTHAGKPASLKKELAMLTSGMDASSPSQQALIRLYSGKGSTEAVFAAIAAMPGTDELQRRDALTEATFFTGGYLQYVARNNKAALGLYEREQNQLNSTSLERPLIIKAAASLQAAKH